jgi:predicted nucleotidyltransferase component of viral defense system
MLSLLQIQAQYPAALQPFSRIILREYLQHKLLQLLYNSALGERFFFLGGTCLRIVHGNSYFSEDLDFDNSGVTAAEFRELVTVVVRGLEQEGYEVDMK